MYDSESEATLTDYIDEHGTGAGSDGGNRDTHMARMQDEQADADADADANANPDRLRLGRYVDAAADLGPVFPARVQHGGPVRECARPSAALTQDARDEPAHNARRDTSEPPAYVDLDGAGPIAVFNAGPALQPQWPRDHGEVHHHPLGGQLAVPDLARPPPAYARRNARHYNRVPQVDFNAPFERQNAIFKLRQGVERTDPAQRWEHELAHIQRVQRDQRWYARRGSHDNGHARRL